MPYVDPARLVADARSGGYAVGAFNMHNVETTQALVLAAEEAKAPVFLQIGRAIVPHMGLRKAYEMTRRVAEESGADVVIHLDHGPEDEVLEAIKLGFGSSCTTARTCRSRRTSAAPAAGRDRPRLRPSVEAELGKIPDADEDVDWSAYYTDVAEAERFVKETGVDWLAISVGIMHGVPMTTPAPLDIDRIARIRDATGIPLVLHGASRQSCPRTRSGRPSRTACTSSTPTPTCGTPSGPASRPSGRRATASWRRRWPRAGPGWSPPPSTR